MRVNTRIPVVLGACVALWVVFQNQLAEDQGLRDIAQAWACERVVCTATFKKEMRGLFGRTFVFSTDRPLLLEVEVTCSRTFWIGGSYSCAVTASRGTGQRSDEHLQFDHRP